MSAYRLTPEAQTNVDEICAFLSEESAGAATRVLDALEKAFVQLATSPEIGHRREDLTALPVKFWSVYSYLIVYDPAGSPLIIVAVLHGARDVEHLLKSLQT